MPDNERMLPETLEKMLSLVREGAIIIGNAPQGLATLKGGGEAQHRFDKAVHELWGNSKENIRTIGKGKVMSGTTIGDALKQLNMTPDVIGGDALWLHRQAKGADWYYVCAPYCSEFQGDLSFNNNGNPEIWNPVSGEIEPATIVEREGDRTSIRFDLVRAGFLFCCFPKDRKNSICSVNNIR